MRLDVAYDGGPYAGWARQPGQRTVQGELEDALARVLGLDVPPRLTVAGRTDAGVHARGQVAHVDLPAELAELTAHPAAPVLGRAVSPGLARLARGLNGVLDRTVRVLAVTLAPPGFDARFSARSRRYAYRVGDAPYGVDPLRRHDTLAWPRPLAAAPMKEAAAALLGEHDFAAYCRQRPGATTVRALLRLDVARDGDGVVTLDVEADAFCHSMVRALAGALLAVGAGRRPPPWPGQVLARGVRDPAVTVVPAHGLTLVAVRYPPDDEVAARARMTRAPRVQAVDGG